MTQTVTRSYPLPAGVDAVHGVLSGERWVEQRAAALHDGSRTERREPTADGGLTVAVSRLLPDGVPGFLAPFLPPDRRVVQTDRWELPAPDGSRRARWSAELPGAPATLGGLLGLLPSGTGCTYQVQGEVRVGIPLVGGRAERFLADVFGRLSDREAELLRSLLPQD